MREQCVRTWFRLLATVLLAFPLAVLSGCGGQDSGGAPGSLTQPPTTGGGGTTPPPAAARPTVTLAPPQPASIVAGGTSTLVATVRDGAGALVDNAVVTFTTATGTVGTVVSLGNGSGQYQASFTSTQAGTAAVIATARVGTETASGVSTTVQVTAGAPSRLSLTASVNQIPPDGTTASQIQVRAEDAFGNPVAGSATVSANLGTLTPPVVPLPAGEGSASFTAGAAGLATITAVLSGTGTPGLTGTVEVNVVATQQGEPASLEIVVAPPTLTVAGVGGTESATVSVTVKDRFGSAISDSPNNVEVELVQRPNGGENLGRDATTGAPLVLARLSTSGGVASATLNSGTLPGTVRIEARVLKDGAGNLLASPLLGSSPRVVIVSGPPFSLALGRNATVLDNQNGSFTRFYSAVVSDLYGNAVQDDTGVFFGQIRNIKAEGVDGVVALATPNRFTSATGAFVANNVARGDTLVLLSAGAPRGGFVVDAVVDATTLALVTPVPVEADLASLRFAVGNNLGGGAFAGPGFTEGGAAESPNTFTHVTRTIVYAETAGRTVGDAADYLTP